VRSVYRHAPLGGDAEEPFRATAPFRGRLAKAGSDVSLSLQSVERCIDRANGDFASSARLDFLAHWDSVSLLAQAHKRQDDYVLEPAEVITVHYIYNSELIEFPAARWKPKVARVLVKRPRQPARLAWQAAREFLESARCGIAATKSWMAGLSPSIPCRRPIAGAFK
jgi:hypothetical protein